MSNRLALLALCVLAFSAALPAEDAAPGASGGSIAAAATGDPVWLTDLDKAKQSAQTEHKLILMAFTGSDWCPFCKKLIANVLSTPEFKTWAGEHFVLLQVDFLHETPQSDAVKEAHRKLAETYQVEKLPTVVFLNADGQALGRLEYEPVGAKQWIADATKVLGKNLEAAAATPANSVTTAAPPADPVWLTDFAQAKALAKKEHKLVFAEFTGSDWCIFCKRLDKEVLSTPEFKAWAAQHVVLARFDFPHNIKVDPAVADAREKLADSYNVNDMFPTIIFTDANGKELAQGGYEEGGVKTWLADVVKILGKNLDESTAPAAGAPATPDAAPATGATTPATTTAASTTSTTGNTASNAATVNTPQTQPGASCPSCGCP
ncbi:MAG: thioredoxin family protein [Planctomycetota bacterium]